VWLVRGTRGARKVLAAFFSISSRSHQFNMEKAAELPEIQLSSSSSKVISTCEDCVQLTGEGLVLSHAVYSIILLEAPTSVPAVIQAI
jgi:hypothetical protein